MAGQVITEKIQKAGQVIAEKIREEIERQGLTIRRAAIRCGTSHVNLLNTLHDPTRRSLETLAKISYGLGVPLSELLKPIEEELKIGKQREGNRP